MSNKDFFVFCTPVCVGTRGSKTKRCAHGSYKCPADFGHLLDVILVHAPQLLWFLWP